MTSPNHFSSRTDEWGTPLQLFATLNREFRFTLDPASTHANAKCALHYTREDNGLAQDWGQHTVWMNPPYGNAIPRWVDKAIHSAAHGATVATLLPCRTDTRWYAACLEHASELRMIQGRLRFEGA